MEKTMKSSATKTIVVQLTADNVQEFDIDCSVYDDPLLEAATRAVEKSRRQKGSIIRPVAQCWEKDAPKKTGLSGLYNSYWVLVNAECYAKAEQLREKFKAQTECDLKDEPICGSKKKKAKK